MNQSTSHLDKSQLSNLADEIWKSAERLRGKFRANEYQTVIPTTSSSGNVRLHI